MTIEELAKAVDERREFSSREQEEAFALIFQRFLALNDPLAITFAKFNFENFLNGYVETAANDLSDNFKAEIAKRHKMAAVKAAPFYADAIYFLCRFLLQKNQMEIAAALCRLFLKEKQAALAQIDPLTLSYLKHFSQTKDKNRTANGDPIKQAQASIYAAVNVQQARQELTGGFLTDPFEPAFKEFEPAIRPILAQISLKKQRG